MQNAQNVHQFIASSYTPGTANIVKDEKGFTVTADRKGDGGGMQNAVVGVHLAIAQWVYATINGR